MVEGISPEVGMGRKIELQLGNAKITVRPNAQITCFDIGDRYIFFHADKLRTLAGTTDTDTIVDTNEEGGSFVAWPFGSNAKKFIPAIPAIHGPAALLTQWKTVPVAPEMKNTVAVLEKNGGRYFEQAFGTDNYNLHRVVALTGSDLGPHAQLSTTLLYNGGEDEKVQGNLYALAEHPYFQVKNYEEAHIVCKGVDGQLYPKPLRDFEHETENGEMQLNDYYTNAEVEARSGEVWLLPDGPHGPVVVIKRSVTIQKADGSFVRDMLPTKWVLYHKTDSKHINPAAVAIEPVVGDYDNPTMLSAGERVTQTVDISMVGSLGELKV